MSNLTHKQQLIHLQFWNLNRREIIKELYHIEFPGGLHNAEMFNFISQGDRSRAINEYYLANRSIYTCPCGSTTTLCS